MERKNTLLLTVIAVATLLVAVIGATFAYFTATATGTASSQVTVTTKSIDTVNTSASALTLDVNLTDMLQENGKDDYSVSKSSTATLSIEAGTGTGGGTNTCTYDLVYTPGYTMFDYSEKNTGKLKELTISGTASKGGSGVASTTTFAEKDLAGLAIDTPVTLVDNATFAVTGVSQADTLTWTVTARFYNLGVDQSSNAGKTFGGTLEFKEVSCVNS